jgi:energy-coupling factor transporter ATP-binding protein EcfA2
MDLDCKKLVFISGKGGTGKTTFAVLLAHQLARSSKKVLLVELGAQSSVKALANLEQSVEYTPRATRLGFDLSLLQGRDCLIEYISSFTLTGGLTKQFFDNRLIKSLVDVAPGLNDLAVLGKLTSHIRGHGPGFQYDHIIIDAHSTGSFLSLLNSPQYLGASVSRGPLKKQSQSIETVLKDPKLTDYFFVSLLEELPMDELQDTLANFNYNQPDQIKLIMNKYVGLADLKIDDPVWQSFMGKKLAQQEQQKERLKQMSHPTYFLPFRRGSLGELASDSAKEFLV